MKYLIYLTLVLLVQPAYSKSFGNYEGAVYLKNYDGDTVRFNLPGYPPIVGNDIRVRVNGIDTPEIKGKCEKEKYEAQQARDMVTDILKDAKKITLNNMKRGKYFRIAADIIVDGESLADLLVEAGMAVKYDGGKKKKVWCDSANE
jgi:micrococcal nuclease